MNKKFLSAAKKIYFVLFMIMLLNVLSIISCHQPTNPVHPESNSYQGFDTVDDPNEVESYGENGKEFIWQDFDFTISEVNGADFYELEIAEDENFESKVYSSTDSDASFLDPVMRPIVDLTASTTYYWHSRAVKGVSVGNWTESCNFSMINVIIGVGPENGAWTNDTTPTLSWDAVDGADHYELQIAETEAVVESATAIESSTPEYTPSTSLSNNQSHYWRVRAVDGDGVATAWSSIYRLSVSWGEITGMSPADGATTADTNPTFSWNVVTEAVSYEVQIAETEAGVETVTAIESASAEYTPASSLENNQAHYWRVRAVNGDGVATAWSKIYRLGVSWGEITEMSPTDESTTADTTPTFTWNSVDGADHYEVQIAETEAGVESATAVESSTTEYTPATSLTNNQSHYWRVKAIDGAGTEGDWSSIFSIEVSFGEITGMSPTDESTTADTTPTFTWNSVDGGDHYKVQIAETEAGVESTTAIESASAEYTPATSLTNNQSHYWRVKAIDGAGTEGDWSSIFSIEVSFGEITGMSPADGATTADTTPMLSWDEVAEAVSYEVQIAETEAGVESTTAIESSTTEYTPATSLTNNQSHYWRVKAIDGAGTEGDWSSILLINITDSPSVGDYGQAGGIVYYDKGSSSDGWRYLEAAPAETEWNNKRWGDYNTPDVGGTSTAIGTGADNTTAIVSAYGANEPFNGLSDYAAILCDDLVTAGYSDWFLPSKDELNLMYQNLYREGIGGFASGSFDHYCSSSVSVSYKVWIQWFGNGTQLSSSYTGLYSEYRVRASRAF